MSFNLASIERGELCHDRCMVLLPKERMQDIGTAKPNGGGAIVQALDLSQGFRDFGDGQSVCWGSGVNRVMGRGLWGESDIEYEP